MREEEDHKGTLKGCAAVIVTIGGPGGLIVAIGGLIAILVNLGFIKPPFASPTTSPYSIPTPIPQSRSNSSAPQLPSDTPIPQLPSNTPIQQLPTNTSTLVSSGNRSPNVPSLVSPVTNTGMAFGSAPRLCGQHNGDPDGDAIREYVFKVNGPESYDSGWVGSSCVDVPTSYVDTAGTYYWLMGVRDARGGVATSGTWYFVIRANVPTTAAPAANKIPNKPSNVSPATNTSFQLGTAPTLCVQHNSDPDGDAITAYNITVTDGKVKYYDSGWVTSSCITPPTNFITSAGAYYWHARVRDARGGESEWGPTWNIPALATNKNPNKPNNVSPKTNTGFNLGATVQLCGLHTGDPDGDAITKYQFILNGPGTKDWDSGLITSDCVNVPASAINSKGTYYWLMRVYDTRGGTTSSETWYFVIR